MDNNRKEALRWYRQGTKDGKTAKKNEQNGDYEVACFLYQQAAEKILKAFLYLQGERPVIGHATLTLAKKCIDYDHRFEQILDSCIELDIFYIPTRYPNGIPDGVPYEYYKRHHADRAEQAYVSVLKAVEPHFTRS